MKVSRRHAIVGATCFVASCSKPVEHQVQAADIYEVFDTRFWSLLDPSQTFEPLGSGYQWSEGPTWNQSQETLYFTDVPRNIAYSWNRDQGVREFLNPSGAAAVEGFREPGANGLLMDSDARLFLCNHGNRSVEELDMSTQIRTTIASEFRGKKFNSPNDLIRNQNGDLFFTDPPYGLEGMNDSPLKEQPHNGVYKTTMSADVTLLIDDLTFPNGIALSPDEKFLYVAQSDPQAPHLYRLDLTSKASKELLFDFTEYQGEAFPGLPDGMALDEKGNIFVTGPGGVFVIQSDGTPLGRILTGKASANCTFGEDGRTLFITNHDRLLRLRTRTKGLS